MEAHYGEAGSTFRDDGGGHGLRTMIILGSMLMMFVLTAVMIVLRARAYY